ncbi:MAG: hypothetical protein R8F63_13525 [Acidimicrobiales bacterium]|nr:hypothetical protein [Acidimicrobiales bacterium]
MAEVSTTGVRAAVRNVARRSLKRVPVAHRLAKEGVVALKLARYRRAKARRDGDGGGDEAWQAPLEGWSDLGVEAVRSRASAAGVGVAEVDDGLVVAPGSAAPSVFGPAAAVFPPDAEYLVLGTGDRASVDARSVAVTAAWLDGGPRPYDAVATASGGVVVTDAGGSEAVARGVARTALTDRVIDRHEETLHFGDVLSVVNGGERFLYQDVPGRAAPGRRDTTSRIEAIEAMLARHGGGFAGRTVFDVCCNSGMMMGEALARGARWAVGWDLPGVAAAADELLGSLGAGRSSVHGVSIDDDTDFASAVPTWLPVDGSVCLFLAAWHHVSFPTGVAEIPWEYLVFEGKENEDPKVTAENFAAMEKRWSAEVLESSTHADGICGPRPLALLRRVSPAR